MMDDKLLKQKQDKKAKKPAFTRADSHKKQRLNDGWRKPKGWQNKMRLHKRGYKDVVSTGYGTPDALRNKTLKGLAIITISTLKELEAIDPKKEAALISKVGRKKKEELIAAAQKKGVALVNLSVKTYQEKTQAALKAKAEKRKELDEKAAEKEKKAKEAEAAAKKKEEEKKAKEAEEKTDEEKKSEEKKELDKVLTSKKGM